MLFCDVAHAQSKAFDDLAVFVSQARAVGAPMQINETALSDVKLNVGQTFDLSPFLTTDLPDSEDLLILLHAHALSDRRMRHLRKLANGKALRTIAYGAFETAQKRIGTAARLSYVLGVEPDMREIVQRSGFPDASIPIFGARAGLRPRGSKLNVSLVFPPLANPSDRQALLPLLKCDSLSIKIITEGKLKEKWLQSNGFEVPVYHPGEVLPISLSRETDVAVLLGKPLSWSRQQAYLANLLQNGSALVDATPKREWSEVGESFIEGPVDFVALAAWLVSDILPSLDSIEVATERTSLYATFMPPKELLGGKTTHHQKMTAAQTSGARKLLFMPTNGVGLGHAKRCTVIAKALEEPKEAAFAAFPSCVGMLTGAGFPTMPLVGRTPFRREHEVDLVNHLRLQSYAESCRGFVFDGGYVFSSVMRAILDNDLPSVWVRRGLWQEGSTSAIALDRQKVFTRVIVPTEAFEELNARPLEKENVVAVGPIVQLLELSSNDKTAIRAELSVRLKRPIERLVVTVLGGGVAADRRAQIASIAAHLDRRDDVTNLIVVYPTAVIEPSWASFSNSVVVQTRHASALLPACDLLISAAGYNSYHEVLYGAVPTVFLPQMASYMDDQRARAVSAAERGLALFAEPWETITLTRLIDECLDGRSVDLKAALRGLNLPVPGAEKAARLIEETCQ